MAPPERSIVLVRDANQDPGPDELVARDPQSSDVGGVTMDEHLRETCARTGRQRRRGHETEASTPMMIKQTIDYYMAKFHVGEEGATATEYIVLLVFIALAIIVGARLLGTSINGAFTRASNSIS
jgi:Flp pilus assembly pilin Flp